MSPDILSPKSADLTAEMLAEARFQQNSAKASATDPAAPEVEGATDYSADRPAAIVTARGDAAAPHDPQQANRAIGQSSVLDALLKASPLPQLAGAAPGALTAAHPPLTGPRDGAAPLRGAPPLSAGASRAQAFTSAAQHSLHCSMPTLPHWPPPTLPRLGRWQRPPPPPTPQGRQAPRSCASVAEQPTGPGFVQSSTTCTAALHNAHPTPPPAAPLGAMAAASAALHPPYGPRGAPLPGSLLPPQPQMPGFLPSSSHAALPEATSHVAPAPLGRATTSHAAAATATPPPPPPPPPPAVAGQAPPPPSHIDAAIRQCNSSAALHNASPSMRPSSAAPLVQPAIAIVPTGSTFNFYELYNGRRYLSTSSATATTSSTPLCPAARCTAGGRTPSRRCSSTTRGPPPTSSSLAPTASGRTALAAITPTGRCSRLESLRRELMRILAPECLEYRCSSFAGTFSGPSLNLLGTTPRRHRLAPPSRSDGAHTTERSP